MISRIKRSFPVLLCLLGVLIWPQSASAEPINKAVPQNQVQMQMSFAPLVKKVAPAVVNIYTSRTVSRMVSPFMNDPFFGQFFGRQGFGGRMRDQVENSLGSGVIIDAGGLVVTNAHVIDGADEIKVVLGDGREFTATLALEDEASDLALLRLETDGAELPYVSLKPSEQLEVGDIVIAIGNPFGVGQTVTSGIVSAQGRSSLDINDFNFFIQTDAAINPGNSGGPLVAMDGGVVGINTAIFSRDGGSLGIGFAIPSEMVASVVAAEAEGLSGARGVLRPWLGVSAQGVTADIAESLGMELPSGALIAGLHSASPLAEAGLKTGDVVTAVNGRAIRDAAEMKFRMATVPIGEETDVEFFRAGQSRSVKVAAIAPPDDPPREATELSGQHPLNGATVGNLNPAVAIELGLGEADMEGVIVLGVARGSSAARLVRPGDILLEINNKSIDDIGDVMQALDRAQHMGWGFVFNRNGQTRELVLR